MSSLRILHLSDDRPGHYHLAEGVIAAISRLRNVETVTLKVKRRRLFPGRYLRKMAAAHWMSPDRLLRLGYGLQARNLPASDVVVSAGGETLPANLAIARLLGAKNIFVGSIRHADPEAFSLVVSSYARHEGKRGHLISLKPSAMNPDVLGRPQRVGALGPDNPPKLAGLLVGGDSGLFKYRQEEWLKLFAFARELSRSWGTRWLLSTSRRTPPAIAQAAFDLAKDKDTVADFIDYKLAGPGTLEKIFSRADMVVCSEDSSTMISEAVWCRVPVIGVSPARHAFKPEEAAYRQMMLENGWCRFLPIAGLSVERLGAALEEIRPLPDNPLDRLAEQLKDALPELAG